MNELFEYHKELNIKKIIIAIIIILFCIVILFEIIGNIINKDSDTNTDKVTQIRDKNIEAQNPNSTFYSENRSISLELSKQYGLFQYYTTNDYLIELRSENNLNIFVSHRNIIENRSLTEVVSADLHAYIENYANYSNLSQIAELNTNNYKGYTYSFHYLDSSNNVPYYLQIVWLETEKGYYIFDIEFPLESLNDYVNIINDTIYSFVIY